MNELPVILPLQGKTPAVAWRVNWWLFQVKLDDGTFYNYRVEHIDLAEAIRLWNKHILENHGR